MGAEVVPRARKSTTLRFLFELEKPDGLLPGTAKLPPPSPEPEADSLIDKIASCTRVFTFVDAVDPISERDAKTERLGEILTAVHSAAKQQRTPLDHRVMVALVNMFRANLFRAMPPPSSPPLPPDGGEEDTPATVLSPAWPHLQAVYDILVAFVASTDAKTLRHHVDRGFLSGLLALFASEDPRERDRLKTAYHQLYAKLTCDRAFMRRSMAHALLAFAHEAAADHCCGVAEVLEICGSIINGFAVPVKDEHSAFLARVLMPLHRTRWAHAYHRQLAYCVLEFVRKEPGLADAVLRGILRRWPVTSCHKEVLLIEELEEVVELLDPDQFQRLAVPVCSRIARCVGSSSSQVAERALYVWNNERFLELASASPGVMEKILPAFVASVESNLEQHWSKCVQQVTASVKALLQEVAPELYARCVDDLAARRAEAEVAAAVRDARWRKVEMAAAAK
ncbi:hypothetical protein PR202_ga16504 [Eleusine coracana subsp. coracana]|uniref:Serine/threonine protein phosphatase 2A regulatory subunit n=1 Tax=Eleusine coracana subsp. coracana TaxID=191504 RepID=A0AAV5CNF0_ELECO|nr:hypothetical protein PR202_ga16504 [Eleusine coracana subsp. coracana]